MNEYMTLLLWFLGYNPCAHSKKLEAMVLIQYFWAKGNSYCALRRATNLSLLLSQDRL